MLGVYKMQHYGELLPLIVRFTELIHFYSKLANFSRKIDSYINYTSRQSLNDPQNSNLSLYYYFFYVINFSELKINAWHYRVYRHIPSMITS